MARFGKNRRRCPFCDSGEQNHELKAGSGGWAIHMYCKTCGAMGPRVAYENNHSWMVIRGMEGGTVAKKARELWYGESEPRLSGRVPPMH